MKTMRSRLTRLAAGLAFLGLPACTVENNGSIAILYNGAAEDDCTINNEPTHYVSRGIADVALGGQSPYGYFAALVVQNRMPSTVVMHPVNTGAGQDRTNERNQFQVRGFEVELEANCEGQDRCDEVSAVVNQTFRTPGAGNVPPLTKQSIPADLLPISVDRGLQGQIGNDRFLVRATIRAYGGRNADEEIESGDFDYYIELCDGCLVHGLDNQCPVSSARPGYCGLPQDTQMDCCLDGDEYICPASVSTTQ